jgi:hypothetical protein
MCGRRRHVRYKPRGIIVCQRWLKFENFRDDMGPMPKDGLRYTIERIDNDKSYTPGNCRWATYKEQGRNKRNNHLITYKRKTQSLAAWAEEMRLPYGALKIRLRSGWSAHTALTTPVPAPHLVDSNGKFAPGRGARRRMR